MGVVYGPLIAGCLVEAVNIYRSDLLLNPPRHRAHALPPVPQPVAADDTALDAVCD